MPRLKGTPKTGGRKSGIPNKRTEMLRDVLEKLECDVPQRLVTLLPQLSPERQSDVLLSLLPYLFPKRGILEDDQMALPAFNNVRLQLQKVLSDPESLKAAQIIAERVIINVE